MIAYQQLKRLELLLPAVVVNRYEPHGGPCAALQRSTSPPT
jgi:hypothetical protein